LFIFSSKITSNASIAILTASSKAVLSKYASSVNGSTTNSDRLILPRLHAPCFGRGCS